MQTKLFRRDFTLVVIGQIISLFGNAILRFALPLYLLRETGSSTLFGVVTACSFAPMVILSMAGGVLADRVNKRNIMVGLDFSTAAIIMLFYFSLGKIPTVPLFIVVLMLLYGISGTYQPAVQASVPLLVAKEKLMAGNAVINQVNTLSGLLGPVIGGVMFTLWGIYPILLLSAACFTFSAIMEIFIHIPHEKRPREVGVFRVVGMDLKESYQFVKSEKPIFFSVVLLVSIFNLVLSAVMIVGTPILITQVLGMSDTMYGFAQGALALGGKLSAQARQIAAEAGVELVDYFARKELILCNAIPTAEGCIGILMAERTRTLWNSAILLAGFGPVGQALGVRLAALGAQVTVAARRPAQRALAESFSLRAVDLARLEQAAPAFDTVVNTIPAPVLTEAVLAALRPGSLIVDLASKPGGTDFAAARRLGHRAIHALSLPTACAPETAGEALARTVCEILAEREGTP